MHERVRHAGVRIRWALVFILLSACIDPIYFDTPPPGVLTVVEGMISDEPGPYVVKVSNAVALDADSVYRPPVEHAKITLYDDEENSEAFTEISPGVYSTGGVIQGVVGHSYHIEIETADGTIFRSEADQLFPGGEVSDIRYEYEARTVHQPYGDLSADVFKIFIDASAEGQRYVRWRFNGTYKVVTEPEHHQIWLQGFILKDPPPCSGYVVAPAVGGGRLEKVAECTCCTCWISQFESQPHVSDDQLVSDGQFRDIKVGEVPINLFTFFDKYRVEVEQMSLSRPAYEFFKLVQSQKEQASNVFQPPSGEIRGNMHNVSSDAPVVGIFYAASVSRKAIFIPKSALPYKIPPLNYTDACTKLANSTNVEPEGWQ